MEHLGRTMMILGGVIVLVGLFLTFGPRLPFQLGRLPYVDIRIQRENFSFYFPLGTSILISIVLTLVFSLFNRR
jgi:hypothetical protein